MRFSLTNNILILKYCQTVSVKPMDQHNTYSLPDFSCTVTLWLLSQRVFTLKHKFIQAFGSDVVFLLSQVIREKKKSVQHAELWLQTSCSTEAIKPLALIFFNRLFWCQFSKREFHTLAPKRYWRLSLYALDKSLRVKKKKFPHCDRSRTCLRGGLGSPGLAG